MIGDQQLTWWRRRIKERCFVYVLRDDHEGPIKIGRATDPHKRIVTFQTGYPYPLGLWRCMPGDHELEWQLHQQFAKTRLLGEWFEPTTETLDFLDRLADFMKVAYSGVGNVPDFRRFEADWIDRSTNSNEVTVRYVTPDPVPVDEAKARERAGLLRRTSVLDTTS